jgi:hypothetical protein
MVLDEWWTKAKRLFGEDENNWRFVCPACGNIQSVGDFRKYKNQGATPNSAYQVCIGRFDGHMDVDMGAGRPCNYHGFGLFQLQKTEVIDEDGKITPVFEFDEGQDDTESSKG